MGHPCRFTTCSRIKWCSSGINSIAIDVERLYCRIKTKESSIGLTKITVKINAALASDLGILDSLALSGLMSRLPPTRAVEVKLVGNYMF